MVIDDTAVTPRYVVGLAPERELPIIGKIASGSLKNKLLFLLPAALLLTAFAPFLITPLLMIGGAYLAFEATEKIVEKLLHDHQHEEQLVDAMADPAELEKLQVTGAIRTDFILSAEIMAIALASLEHLTLAMTAARWRWSPWRITVGVYGVVAMIVKLDDIGLHLAERRSAGARAIGNGAGPCRSEAARAHCRRSAPRRCCGSAAASSSTASRSCTSSTLRPALHPRSRARRPARPVGPLSGRRRMAGQRAWRPRSSGSSSAASSSPSSASFTKHPGRADRRLVEVQPAVAAAEIEQGVEARRRSSP